MDKDDLETTWQPRILPIQVWNGKESDDIDIIVTMPLYPLYKENYRCY